MIPFPPGDVAARIVAVSIGMPGELVAVAGQLALVVIPEGFGTVPHWRGGIGDVRGFPGVATWQLRGKLNLTTFLPNPKQINTQIPMSLM